jgi:hypothetical protein
LLYEVGTLAEGEFFMTKNEALAFTDRATNHLLHHNLQVGMLQVHWATLVHDTLLFADGMNTDDVDEVLHYFQKFYCMGCAKAGIKPHHYEEAAWRKFLAEVDED